MKRGLVVVPQENRMQQQQTDSHWAIEVKPLQIRELTASILQAKSQIVDEGLRWIHRLRVA